MRKPISCVRPTYKTNPLSLWWNLISPTTYLGQTNLCKSNANPYIITPCPKNCRCERQLPKKVWQPAQEPIRNIFGIVTVPYIPAYWRYIAQPSRCRPALQQAPMSKY